MLSALLETIGALAILGSLAVNLRMLRGERRGSASNQRRSIVRRSLDADADKRLLRQGR
jgi:hypothetical protein